MSRRIILTRSNLQTIADKVKAEITGPLVNTFFPVGSVYITKKAPNDGGDPNVLFPGTRWTRLKDAYLCAAVSSADAANATPHGSNTRTSADLPKHSHTVRGTSDYSGSAYTNNTVNAYGSSSNRGFVYQIYYKGDESPVNTGNTVKLLALSTGQIKWYGTHYGSNDNTKWFTLNVTYPAHVHTSLPKYTNTNNGIANIDIQPSHLYRYIWERTA